MGNNVDPERVRDAYYCLAIALIKDCTVEKAIALYEGHSVWITDEIIEEMIEMSKEMKVSEIAEIYRLDPHQVRFYLKRAGAFVPHRKFSNKEKTNDKN